MAAALVRSLLSASATSAGPALHLFDGPYLVIEGRRAELPEGSKRLIVFVALHGGHVERRAAAGNLWPVGNDIRAAGNLRSALWRLRRAGIEIVETDKCALRLLAETTIDLHVVSDWAARLIEGTPTEADLATGAWRSNTLELLPGWYEDWVVFERERLRQRLLHGQEALSRHLIRAGRYPEAVEAAMAVVGVEPLRESAQRVLIEAHLAEGNVAEARRAYEAYRRIAIHELGVVPGPELTALVANRNSPWRTIRTVTGDRPSEQCRASATAGVAG